MRAGVSRLDRVERDGVGSVVIVHKNCIAVGRCIRGAGPEGVS